MLDRYYLRPETIDRIRACWLGASIDQYVIWLTGQGYAARTVLRRVPMLMHFAEYSANRGARTLNELPEHIEGFVALWVREHSSGCKNKASRRQVASTARNPVQQMLRLVLTDYAGHRRRNRPQPFAEAAPDFFDYLREERGLRPASVALYTHNLRRLERYLERIELRQLSGLSPAVLSGFLTASGQVLVKSTLTALCAQLRIFLRYLHRERLLASDLSRSFDCPRVYRLSNIPRAISWDEVRQLLESVDRRSALGKRDYAILLLLVTYGLRAREVAALTLDAIDWKQERLAVPERKGGHSMIFPLSPIVGDAVADYLQHGRPQSNERAVFLRSLAPHTPLGWKPVSELTARRLRRAGIAVHRPGSHTLRHTCVQHLVEAQFSLKAIGDYVGHALPKSTEIYTKLDLEALRELALGDGEELL
jgi:site-specific recombinase XerD